MTEKKIEETIKELEPRLRVLNAIFENPGARDEYKTRIDDEISIQKAEEKEYLEEQRKKISRVDDAADLQEKVYDLAKQIGLDPYDFEKRLDKGEFDNVLTYSCLQDYILFFEEKLRGKLEKKSKLKNKTKDVYLKEVINSFDALEILINSLKTPYNPQIDYQSSWHKVGSDPDVGHMGIKEIYLKLSENLKSKVGIKIGLDWKNKKKVLQDSIYYDFDEIKEKMEFKRKYIEFKVKYGSKIERIIPSLEEELGKFENEKITLIIDHKSTLLNIIQKTYTDFDLKITLEELMPILNRLPHNCEHIDNDWFTIRGIFEHQGKSTKHSDKYSIVNLKEINYKIDKRRAYYVAVGFFRRLFDVCKKDFSYKTLDNVNTENSDRALLEIKHYLGSYFYMDVKEIFDKMFSK